MASFFYFGILIQICYVANGIRSFPQLNEVSQLPFDEEDRLVDHFLLFTDAFKCEEEYSPKKYGLIRLPYLGSQLKVDLVGLEILRYVIRLGYLERWHLSFLVSI